MKYILFAYFFFTSFYGLNAQSNFWTDTNFEGINFNGTQYIFPNKYYSAELDYFQMKDELFRAPLQDFGSNNIFKSPIEISIPLPDGSSEIFKIVESPVYDSALLDSFPGIKTFLAYCPNHPEWYSRFDITPHGFHAIILGTDEGTIYIDPVTHLGLDNSKYLVYYKKDFSRVGESFVCHLDDNAPINTLQNNSANNGTIKMLGSCDLRTYRLAISATAEYTTFHGGTVAGALAAQVTSMNRVNGIFERDIAIRLELISNNNLIIYTNAATDPFTNGNTGAMINQNQTNTDAVIGSANYDIGHIFGTNSGGLAQLNSPCGSGKARGVTGSGAPVGDPFDVDYVAHEIGHQFGARHTQNNNCNRTNATAMEPGSASTIMGYAGICAPNIQNNSDDYFHGISLQEMGNFITGTGNSCAVNTPLSNTAPTLTLPNTSYSIPASTPFSLTALATDPNANTLTYCWEQFNNGIAPMPPEATSTNGPSFRSFDPSTSPTRYFPNLPDVIAGITPTWEVLSSVTRTMDFRIVVRDNAPGGGCNDHEDITVNVVGTAGPFIVTSPNASGITWIGNSNQTVTWNVANTASAPVSCSNVNILISYDGGLSFPDTLATNVSNDGSQGITIPNIGSTSALIIVQCANGTFFDVSNNTFTINQVINDYTFSASNISDVVCINQDANYNLNIGLLGVFTNNVSLSSFGLPIGLNATFSSNNLPPSSTPTLTISNTAAVAAGIYNFNIQANSSTGTKTISASIEIIPNLSGPLSLTAPTNGATSVISPINMTWANISGANYTFTLADDANLNNVIESDMGMSASSFTTGILAANTTYYWQVEAYNSCDTLTSAIFSFTTINCAIYTSTDIPISISDSGTPTITSNLIISGSSGTINDLNIVSLSGTHTWINDLTFTLTSPNNTSVVLLDRICNNQNNFDIQLDDAAANNNYPCPPISGGSFIPEETLSAFNGEDANGIWVLTVSDAADQDGGDLNEWGIEICLDPPIVCTTLFDTAQLIACDSALINGTWYLSSTIISDSLIASNTCDSILTTNLTINSSSPETIINQTTCDAALVGSSFVILTNTANCDSVVTTNTSILNVGVGTENISACDSITVNGITYFVTTNFSETLIGGSSNGCDSILNYDITINNSAVSNETITACDSALVAGTWYFASQTLTQSLSGTNTCDSTHTVDLIINNTIVTSSTLVGCDSAQINGTWYFVSQQVSNTFLGGNNCDSSHTVDLTIRLSSPVTIINQTTCSAASAGSSSITLTNIANCDSVVTTNTSLLNAGVGTENITACDSLTLNGSTYFNTTSFSETLLGGAANGCDSIVNYNITVNNSVITNLIVVACDSAQINGAWYFTSQQISTPFLGGNNCDSTHTVDLTINFSSPTTIINQTTCNATLVGSSSVTLTNIANCDSVVTTNTSLLNAGVGNETLTACDSITISGNTYFSSASFSETLVGGAANGCDSVVSYNITINNSVSTNENITACDSALINGTWYFSSQQISDVFLGSNTCDSSHVTNLIINNSVTSIDVQNSCESFTWIDGLSYTSSNNSATFIDVNGAPNACDLLVTLDLTILPAPSITINNNNGTLEATPGLGIYQWYRDGQIIPGAISDSFTPSLPGTYSCITNNGSCNGSSNEILIGLTNIKDQAFEFVSIYPNPSTGILNIDLGGSTLSSLKLFDLNGKLIRTLNTSQSQFNLSDYAKGMYFLELMNKEQSLIMKVVLE
jgi:subtilisin-like proprotein convertase family protein